MLVHQHTLQCMTKTQITSKKEKQDCLGNQNSQAAADEHFNKVELKLEAI